MEQKKSVFTTEKDILARTDTISVYYDDIDWEQEKEGNGLLLNGKNRFLFWFFRWLADVRGWKGF